MSEVLSETIDSLQQPAFAELLGLQIVEATPEKVVVEVLVGKHLMNRNNVMHGGAIMALADNAGGTLSNTASGGRRQTTLESKTNFFRPLPEGERARAEATILHKGGRSMVIETRIYRADGKLAALVVQTQMPLEAPKL